MCFTGNRWGYFEGQLPRLNFPSTIKRSSSTAESELVTTGTPENKLHSSFNVNNDSPDLNLMSGDVSL